MDIVIKRLEPNHLSAAAYLLTKSQQIALSKGACLGLLAMVEGAGVGVSLFCTSQTAITATLVTVAPSHRRLGVGTALVSSLKQLALHQKKNLVFPFAATDNSDPIHRFFTSQPNGQTVQQPEYNATITRQNLQRHLQAFAAYDLQSARPLLSQPSAYLQSFAQYISGNFPTIGQTLQFAPETFSAELSFCTLQSHEISSACILEMGVDFANLVLVHSRSGHGSAAIKSILAAIHACLKQPNLQRLNLVISQKSSGKILQKMCPDHIRTHTIYHTYF